MLKLTFFQLYHQRVHGFSAHYLLHSSRRDQHHGPETASHLPQLLADLCHAPLQPSASGHSSYNNVLFKVPSTGELPQKAMDRLLPFPRKIIFQIIKKETKTLFRKLSSLLSQNKIKIGQNMFFKMKK